MTDSDTLTRPRPESTFPRQEEIAPLDLDAVREAMIGLAPQRRDTADGAEAAERAPPPEPASAPPIPADAQSAAIKPLRPDFAPDEPPAAATAAFDVRPSPDQQPSAGMAEPVDLEPVAQAMMELAPTREEVPSAARVLEPVTSDVALAALPAAAAIVSEEAQAKTPATEPALAPTPKAPAALAVPPATIGVLLVNLGTPEAAEPKAVRRYLREFLSDRRVIENDTTLWRFVLNAIILPFRPRSKARAYRKIWNTERNESPLKTITRAQAEKLAATFAEVDPRIAVDWAMRYGKPSIASRLDALIARGCERILLMPLYPQYSAPTTATACDVVFRALTRMRRQPALRVLPAYYADPVYIEALASSIEAHLRTLEFEPDVILASYHGMPRDYVSKGDPYEQQCIETTRLLRERLGLDEGKLMLTFQSRFGRGKWLEPYTDKTVKKLAKSGVKNLAVVTPGFSADCLETLEEIAVENAHIFRKYGGQNFTAIPCLNDSEAGMTVIWQTALRELKGWV